MQAERIRQSKPWSRSTGPRTAKGKACASQNGLTHGLTSEAARLLQDALRDQKALTAALERAMKMENQPRE